MLRPSLPFTVAALIISLVGMADAAIGTTWDHFVLFCVLAGLQVVVLASAAAGRVPVSLRPDLARWATQRSQRTGEPVNDVIDRSVAWFQSGLYGAVVADDD